jgi:hypothetical protein
MRGLLLYSIFTLFLISCAVRNEAPVEADPFGFTLLSKESSGITFRNDLQHSEELNTYTYRNFYNGAGVALGDINNDGLIDIYFCGNQVDNQLYLNQGGLKFKNITEISGTASSGVWSTGASMVDVNGDGLLDIYVCKSGPPGGKNRHNQLFINNGDLTFTERSEEYGVDNKGLSSHAAFFDFDKDGDLDIYLLNNSLRSIGVYDLREGQREVRDPEGGNKLYRNDGNRFTDISEEAGIYGSAIGFGLGVTVADIDLDGWQDIFVSNDFFERDYLYINNRNGTFAEKLEELMPEISMGSMGADIADLNNDGFPEIYVTEMLPEDLKRVKTKTLFEDWDKYQANIKSGYHHQFTRNVLQLNSGYIDESKKRVAFQEIARISGVHATDWSWGALLFDYNNDGLKDIFVANGIYKDLTDHDYINFSANKNFFTASNKKDSSILISLVDQIPSVPLKNYLFQNDGELNFKNVAPIKGLSKESFSNGAAYGDLDNDGDLDLVINNINEEPFIYINNSQSATTGNNYIKIILRGEKNNTYGLGAKVHLYCNGDYFYQEQNPMRGYLSTADNRLNFGIGKHQKVDSLIVSWPSGKKTVLKSVDPNSTLTIHESDADENPLRNSSKTPSPIYHLSATKIDYVHKENDFVDFDRDRLLFEMYSNEGPAAAVGDVNGDGIDDLFLGGAKDQPGQLFIGTNDGFILKPGNFFSAHEKSEDIDAAFFDADGDKDLDLYVASGGNEFSYNSILLRDRIYINDGKGNFSLRANFSDHKNNSSTSFVKVLDYDTDGDYDLLIGSRLVPFYYGLPADVYLLENDGNGYFKDVTKHKAPEFIKMGMITDAALEDFDGDGDTDVIFTLEWGPVKIFKNENQKFHEVKNKLPLNGLFTTIQTGDFNNDGLQDAIVGNMGLNTRLEASKDEPLKLYINDFDNNGNIEHILCQQDGGRDIPLVMLQDLGKQIPGVKKKYLSYNKYKDESMTDIFSQDQLAKSVLHQVNILKSIILINKGELNFEIIDLPKEAQLTKLYAIFSTDFNDDGNLDLIIGGNQSRMKPELGINMGSYGAVFKGNGNGTFNYLSLSESGIFVRGEIREIVEVKNNKDQNLLFIRNNEEVISFKKNGLN